MLKLKRLQRNFYTWKELLVIVSCFIIQFSYPVLGNDNINCTAAGRFADSNDLECRKYIVCIGRGSEIIKFTLSCTSTTMFDPERKICTSSDTFLCPAAKIINEEPPYNASLPTQDNTKFSPPSNTTNSQNNSEIVGDSLTKDSNTVINSTAYEKPLIVIDQNPIENKTDSTFSKVTELATDIINQSMSTNLMYKVTTISPDGDNLIQANVSSNAIIFDPSKYCQRKGLIPNPHSEDCSTFILCAVNRDIFTAIVLQCPASTLFDQVTSFCESTSKCKSLNKDLSFDIQNITHTTETVDFEMLTDFPATSTTREVEVVTLAPRKCNWWCRIDNFVGKLFR